MTSVSAAEPIATQKPGSLLEQKMSKAKPNRLALLGFVLLLAGGVGYILVAVRHDVMSAPRSSVFPYLLLGLALVIALGFEFVNGFHDTANAVATCIYTHSLDPNVAVIYSGAMNFVGVLMSSGTVAFAIISLLPVELILRVGQGSGFSMVFALLVAAILWNLATWWRGLPASSSHTMIGSILGVGVANELLEGNSGTAGVDWAQVTKVAEALLVSPVVGFVLAALVFWLFKYVAKDPRLYQAPEGPEPPPFYIRLLLIATCGGVSYAHGSNDGQKGMGLIMLILVGTVPTAYALNHTVSAQEVQTFAAVSTQTAGALSHYQTSTAVPANASMELEHFISTKKYEPGVVNALIAQVESIRSEATGHGSLTNVPANMQTNVRNKMYLTSESLRLLPKLGPKVDSADQEVLTNYRDFLDRSTRFIPTWVKVAVALALGLGTMVGWKRIVVTVGEKIGKTHLTYAQGASAELVAMFTILAADGWGVPVSTTHVLSSGVAGTMAANHSGLQMGTIRNIVLAWTFTLPAAALISGLLFWLFSAIAR